VIITARGSPVEPEVNWRKAISSAPTGGGSNPTVGGIDASSEGVMAPARARSNPPDAACSRKPSLVTTNRAPSVPITCSTLPSWVSAAASPVAPELATGHAPRKSNPSHASIHSSEVGSATMTGSRGPTPNASNRAAATLASS
jgi:hypothetical protein